MREGQKRMLEAIGKRNDAIERLSQSFGEGMKKLDEQADDMLEQMSGIKKQVRKFKNLFVKLEEEWK